MGKTGVNREMPICRFWARAELDTESVFLLTLDIIELISRLAWNAW